MTAEELMIGDWVQIVPDAPVMANEYHRIDWIKTGEIGLDNRKIVTYPYIQPIPLTPEIFEKNEFKNIDEDNDCYGFYIYWRNENGYSIGMQDLHLHFVHELQHALRLCGIKDIEL